MNQINPKRILITGAAGFIGFHLAKALKARGDFVLGFDNFNPYYDVSLKRARAAELAKKGVEVIEGSLLDHHLFEQIAEKSNPTHILHMAAQAGVRYSIEEPQAYIDANISGFLQVLEFCRKRTQIKLIYASSSSVYGQSQKLPFSIDQSTDSPESFYAVTKKTNELMASCYARLYGIRALGLRFFTVYGPWGRPDMAYYSFAKKIIDGQPLPVFNGGMMSRDFTYIDDIVDGVVAAVDIEVDAALLNLGNSHPETLISLIEGLEHALGKKADVQFLPMQAGDVQATYADISQAERLLGYKPKVSLDEGLKRFVDWFNP